MLYAPWDFANYSSIKLTSYWALPEDHSYISCQATKGAQREQLK